MLRPPPAEPTGHPVGPERAAVAARRRRRCASPRRRGAGRRHDHALAPGPGVAAPSPSSPAPTARRPTPRSVRHHPDELRSPSAGRACDGASGCSASIPRSNASGCPTAGWRATSSPSPTSSPPALHRRHHPGGAVGARRPPRPPGSRRRRRRRRPGRSGATLWQIPIWGKVRRDRPFGGRVHHLDAEPGRPGRQGDRRGGLRHPDHAGRPGRRTTVRSCTPTSWTACSTASRSCCGEGGERTPGDDRRLLRPHVVARRRPLGARPRWYEARKYGLTVAALPRRRYRRAFEPGCGSGLLTALLAPRVDRIWWRPIAAPAAWT